MICYCFCLQNLVRLHLLAPRSYSMTFTQVILESLVYQAEMAYLV